MVPVTSAAGPGYVLGLMEGCTGYGVGLWRSDAGQQLCVHDEASLRAVSCSAPHAAPVRHAHRKDQNTIVSGGQDGTVAVSDVRLARPAAVFRGSAGGRPVTGTASRADQHVVAAGSGSGVWLVDLRTGRPLAVLEGHAEEAVSCCAWGPLLLAVGGEDGQVSLWSDQEGGWRTDEALVEVLMEDVAVDRLQWTGDGGLAVGSLQQTTVWREGCPDQRTPAAPGSFGLAGWTQAGLPVWAHRDGMLEAPGGFLLAGGHTALSRAFLETPAGIYTGSEDGLLVKWGHATMNGNDGRDGLGNGPVRNRQNNGRDSMY